MEIGEKMQKISFARASPVMKKISDCMQSVH